MNAFARTVQLLGDEGFAKLRKARIAVFGLGAVGSFAAEALARAGVGYLRLVDFDTVKESNINRQLYALGSTIGKLKAEVACARIRDINSACTVDIRPVFADKDTREELLEPPLDIVIDAIDGLGPKIGLIHAAVSRGLTVVSSMGAAGRTDPACIRIGDISQSHTCPLARFVRKKLHRLGIYKGVQCVYSVERVRNTLASEDVAIEEETFEKGRTRNPIGSISYIPAIFGLMAAGEAVGMVLEKKD
jgi:tRNA A37 threonylcarbamoyladenosine dehydratase